MTQYNETIRVATVRWAMLEQIRKPSPCFDSVVRAHFWKKRKEIETQIEQWIAEMEKQVKKEGRTLKAIVTAAANSFVSSSSAAAAAASSSSSTTISPLVKASSNKTSMELVQLKVFTNKIVY